MNLDEYEDYDFDDLPGDVKASIQSLGYTRNIWDNDGKPLKEGTSVWWVLKMLWPSLWTHRTTVILLWIALTGQVISTVALAISLEALFDDAIPDADIYGVFQIGLSLLGILALASGAAMLQARWIAQLSAGVVYDLKKRIFQHILRLPPATVSKARSGDLLAHFSTDMAPVAEAVGSGFPYLIMYLFVVIGCMGTIIWIDWCAGLGTLIIFGGGALLSRGLPKSTSQATRDFKDAESRLLSLTSESIRNHVLINIFGLTQLFTQRFEVVATNQRSAQDKTEYRLYLAEMLAEYSSMALVAITVVGGALLAIYGHVTPGALVAIFTLLIYTQDAVYEMATSSTDLIEASGGLARIQELLEQPLENLDDDKLSAKPLTEEIRFENVKLSFGKTQVLSGVSFSAKRGQHVAIVGRSGSGKSTILKLTMRLLEPNEGTIKWDGKDTQTLSRQSLRDQLGVVFQEPMLIGNTLKEVISLGREDVSDENIKSAIRSAALEELIATLPQGIESPIGEEARELSMGQRMRIALARALLRNPSVLILDEVSAALDTSTEAQIIDTISDLSKDLTTISVTHRLSVAQHADHIIILDEGKIIEEGSHQELLEAGGYYASIHEQQTAISSKEGTLSIAGDHLAKIPILSHIKGEKRASLAASFKTCRFSPGSTVIRKGEPAEEFYILHRGKLEVVLDDEVIARLVDGDFFGEMGLLFSIPRAATVRAQTPASCLRLDRKDFDRLVADDQQIEKALIAVARSRGARTSPVDLGSTLFNPEIHTKVSQSFKGLKHESGKEPSTQNNQENKMSKEYLDYDFDELPENAQAAAVTLGYTQETWDNDETPADLDDSDWDELSKDEQDAAKVFGYDQASWDAE